MSTTARADACPKRLKHTVSPSGYVAWHEWAAEMKGDGYRARVCEGCGLYAIWEKKK